MEIKICSACGHVVEHHKANCAVDNCSCPSFAAYGPPEQTCPRRHESPGAIESTPMDTWSTSRWGPYYGAEWPEAFEKPRTCSYCGGINPDDAISLVMRGWEIEGTTKGYKRYMHPPGYLKWSGNFLERMAGNDEQPEHIGPTPPVKLYVMHFDEDQIQKFNAAVKAAKANSEAAEKVS